MINMHGEIEASNFTHYKLTQNVEIGVALG